MANASEAPLAWVECRWSDSKGGTGGGLALEPGESASFAASRSGDQRLELSLRWTEPGTERSFEFEAKAGESLRLEILGPARVLKAPAAAPR